jgi:hypothetical protein
MLMLARNFFAPLLSGFSKLALKTIGTVESRLATPALTV